MLRGGQVGQVAQGPSGQSGLNHPMLQELRCFNVNKQQAVIFQSNFLDPENFLLGLLIGGSSFFFSPWPLNFLGRPGYNLPQI